MRLTTFRQVSNSAKNPPHNLLTICVTRCSPKRMHAVMLGGCTIGRHHAPVSVKTNDLNRSAYLKE